jgi:uncharacterized protein
MMLFMHNSPRRGILFLGASILLVLGIAALVVFRGEASTVLVRVGEAPSVTVELADTESLRASGLSGRASLEEHQGMLFLFDAPGYYTFWMKDMRFPLDLIWINGETVVGVTKNALPEGTHPVQLYTPPLPADAVLEVNAGFAEVYGIKTGDMVLVTGL